MMWEQFDLDQESRSDPFAEFDEDDFGAGDDEDGGVATAEADSNQDADWEAQLEAVGHDPGLGLLLDLARRSDCDPWDVDVVSVCDRYLEALDEKLDAFDLGNAGRVMFYAAALHHMKAQAVAQQEADRKALESAVDDMFAFDDPLDMDGMLGGRLRPDDMPLLYPDFMRDPDGPRGGTLSPRDRRPRARGLTLVDLIVALREYDDRLAEQEALAAEEERFEEVALEECVGSSHQDDLEADIVNVRHLLWEQLGEEAVLELQDLVTDSRSRAASFLALLFLAHDEEVELHQTDFYGQLHIKRGPHFGEVRAGVVFDDETTDEDEALRDGEDETTDEDDSFVEGRDDEDCADEDCADEDCADEDCADEDPEHEDESDADRISERDESFESEEQEGLGSKVDAEDVLDGRQQEDA
jgi:segregation and condensation protein A